MINRDKNSQQAELPELLEALLEIKETAAWQIFLRRVREQRDRAFSDMMAVDSDETLQLIEARAMYRAFDIICAIDSDMYGDIQQIRADIGER